MKYKKHIARLGSDDDDVGRQAEWLLQRYYLKRAVPDLLAACDSDNANMRMRAGWLLGLSKDPQVWSTIVRLTDDADPTVRYEATMALGRHGDIRGLDVLYRLALRPDPVDCQDSAAAMAMARLGTPALDYAMHRLPAGKTLTAYLAQRIGGPVALQVLHELVNDPDPEVRLVARDELDTLLSQ